VDTVARWALAVAAAALLACGCETRAVTKKTVAQQHSARDDASDPTGESSPPAAPAEPTMPSPHGPMGMDSEAAPFPFDFTVPKTWTRQRPRYSMLAGEYLLPRAEGDPADARLTLICVGGTVQANLDRWRAQFGGNLEHDSQERIKVSGRPATLVDLSGTFADQAGQSAPAVERKDYRLLAAVVEGGGLNCVIKCYGPARTMAAHAGEFRSFVESLKQKNKEQ
jgi:hypothetical protein